MAGTQGAGAGRTRLVFAILLSLGAPGTGHFLHGAFRQGAAWALGLAGLGLAACFALPVSVLTFAGLVVIGVGGRIAAAIDSTRVATIRPAWKRVFVAWGAYLGAAILFSVLAEEPARTYYRAHYAESFTIPSGGMEPTLLVGDYILADNSDYRSRPPRRGDIVLFRYPKDERRVFIKRVVALPGEQVLIRGSEVYVNSAPLVERYVKGREAVQTDPGHCGYAYGCEPTTVPPDSYFVLGDNRENSQDSRYWGFVTREKITGRAFTIYWSWDSSLHWARFDRIGRPL